MILVAGLVHAPIYNTAITVFPSKAAKSLVIALLHPQALT